jgi:predicted TIM-barrel enzyme
MREFGTLGKRKAVLGMVHLAPLPGTRLLSGDRRVKSSRRCSTTCSRAMWPPTWPNA